MPLTVMGGPAFDGAHAFATHSELRLYEPRPCIPADGTGQCSVSRAALWQGEADAWAERGVAESDERFRETVLLRVRAGDPLAISTIARALGWPYVVVTSLRFATNGTGPPVEMVRIENLGGAAQDLSGWMVRSPDTDEHVTLPDGLVLDAGEACIVPSAGPLTSTCGAQFTREDVWPDRGGTVELIAAPLGLMADSRQYSGDLDEQPPPPHLQAVRPVLSPEAIPALLVRAIGQEIERQAKEGTLPARPYAGACAYASVEEDVGKLCSIVRPLNAANTLMRVAVGQTFSEVSLIIIFERYDDAWVVVNRFPALPP